MRGLIATFVRNTTWANAFMWSTILLGLISYFLLKKSFFPETRVKDIFIEVTNLGTSPTEMEEGVTIKIEEALKGIAGIDETSSTTSENYAQVHVITEKGYEIDDVLADVKNAVDQISSFPDNAELPKVYKRKPLSGAIRLNLYGNVSDQHLKEVADFVEDDFLASGVMSQLEIRGKPELELVIEINEEQLKRYNITIEQIAQRIRAENRDISAGSIKTLEEELIVRSEQKTVKPKALKNIIIKTSENGGMVKLKDLAAVSLKPKENSTILLYQGKPTVAIRIDKLPEEDIIEITDYAKAYMKAFNDQNKNLQMAVQFDYSVMLNQRIDLLTKNGGIGLLLVVIVLGLFLNLRLALWVAIGIPISFLGMVYLANMAGITINQLSLFGMILVIGILVDDGIVIAENIYSKIEKGMIARKAAVEGTMQVLPSVITSILTTIIVFSLFFFLDGRLGEFMFEMALVVILCLGYSLFEATIILPAHLKHLSKPKKESKFRLKFNGFLDRIRKRGYGRFIRLTIRYRFHVLIIYILSVILGFSLIGNLVPTSRFPVLDSDYVDINLELKPGTRQDETLKYLKSFEESIWVVNEQMKDTLQGRDLMQATRIEVMPQGNKGLVNVKLLPSHERNDLSSTFITNIIKKKIGPVPEAEKLSSGGQMWWGKPVSIILKGKKLDELYDAKIDLKNALDQMPELVDIVDNNELGNREIKLELKDKAYLLGLTTNQVAQQIRNSFFGNEVQRLQNGADEVKLWIRFPIENRSLISQLDQLKITIAEGGEYPLNTIANYTIARELLNIKHYNGARQITVEADLFDPDEPTTPLMERINASILPKVLANYPSVSVDKGGQEREGQKLWGSIASAGGIALILIYMLLSVNFKSFLQPLTIIIMIPIGIGAATFGHYIHDTTMVFMSFIGCFALSGVIINDAVVFLDRYNENLKNDMKVGRAIYEAGLSRFRPILLTSITTVVGLYPLIFEKSRQAQFLVPMAISVAWGILVGTIFILIVFPSLIMLLNDIRYYWNWFLTGKKPLREEVEPSYQQKLDQALDEE